MQVSPSNEGSGWWYIGVPNELIPGNLGDMGNEKFI